MNIASQLNYSFDESIYNIETSVSRYSYLCLALIPQSIGVRG